MYSIKLKLFLSIILFVNALLTLYGAEFLYETNIKTKTHTIPQKLPFNENNKKKKHQLTLKAVCPFGYIWIRL